MKPSVMLSIKCMLSLSKIKVKPKNKLWVHVVTRSGCWAVVSTPALLEERGTEHLWVCLPLIHRNGHLTTWRAWGRNSWPPREAMARQTAVSDTELSVCSSHLWSGALLPPTVICNNLVITENQEFIISKQIC